MNGDRDGRNLSSLFRPYDAELAATKHEKAEYRQQLAEVQEHIHRLKLIEQSLETKLSLCEAVLAPIRLVPDDLLWEIFTQTLPEKAVPLKLSRFQTPLLLMHVCRRWRMVALACPSLWKYIHVPVPENTVEGVAKMRQMTEILAQSAPPSLFNLRVTWASSRFLSSDLFARVGQSITGLGLHSIPIVNLISLPSGLFPCLERLVISSTRNGGWEAFRELYSIEAFNGLPRLHQVALSDWFHEGKGDSGTIRISLPWSQLTHLHLIQPLFSEGVGAVMHYFTHHLPRSNNLRYLRLTVPITRGGSWAKLPTISLPTLEALCLALDFLDNDVHELLSKMDFPNLIFLRLEGDGDDLDDPDHVNNRLQIALRSLTGNVLHLSLQFGDIAPSMLRGILAHAPKVELFDLNIESYREGDLALNQLEWTPTSQLLPRLRSLILRPWLFESRTATDTLMRVIRSRLNRAHQPAQEHLRKVFAYTGVSVRHDQAQEYIDRGILVLDEDPLKDSPNAWMKDHNSFLRDWFELHYAAKW